MLPVQVPSIDIDFCVSGCGALGSHRLLLVDGRVTSRELLEYYSMAVGEP